MFASRVDQNLNNPASGWMDPSHGDLTDQAPKLPFGCPDNSHTGGQLSERPEEPGGMLGVRNQFDGVAFVTVPDDRRSTPGAEVGEHDHAILVG